MSITYAIAAHDFTADELAPDTLIHCTGCDRDVEPHVLVACDSCGHDVCCASVETLSTGDVMLCRKCDAALEICDHCGEYTLAVTPIESRDVSVGYAEMQYVCSVCLPKRRAA